MIEIIPKKIIATYTKQPVPSDFMNVYSLNNKSSYYLHLCRTLNVFMFFLFISCCNIDRSGCYFFFNSILIFSTLSKRDKEYLFSTDERRNFISTRIFEYILKKDNSAKKLSFFPTNNLKIALSIMFKRYNIFNACGK